MKPHALTRWLIVGTMGVPFLAGCNHVGSRPEPAGPIIPSPPYAGYYGGGVRRPSAAAQPSPPPSSAPQSLRAPAVAFAGPPRAGLDSPAVLSGTVTPGPAPSACPVAEPSTAAKN